jgi:hypothetical protein
VASCATAALEKKLDPVQKGTQEDTPANRKYFVIAMGFNQIRGSKIQPQRQSPWQLFSPGILVARKEHLFHPTKTISVPNVGK